MVSEVDAMYAETRGETGLAAMSDEVRSAMGRVERHRLVPAAQLDAAYANHPLPIGAGQTISQPYIVALSTDLLRINAGSVVLDVGTGSGYQAAVLAEIAAKVYSVEAIPGLAHEASARLADLGYANVEVHVADGYEGWPSGGPFDGIVVTAAAPSIPPALIEQLKPGGRMVIPIGASGGIQWLVLVSKKRDRSFEEKRILPVRFVPLVEP